jgi:hypothetical protein
MTKYIELVFRGIIETRSVKPRQTANNNPAYKIYLLTEVQCLIHQNELRKLKYIKIYINKFNYKYSVTYIYCKGFNNFSCPIHLRQQYMYFLFNRTKLKVFVT